MAQREQTARIIIPTWLADLRSVYESSRIGPGAVGLLELLDVQLEQAKGYVDQLSGDVFVERGLGSWREDHAASVARWEWMATRFAEIVGRGDPAEVRLIEIENFIAAPILRGRYPAPMMAALQPEHRRGIITQSDGSGVGFGDAVASATLWNSAVVAADIDGKLGPLGGRTAIEDSIRRMFSRAATQVRLSAPGEDPTLADATASTLETLAAAPGQLLQAIGAGNLLLYVGIGAGLFVAWKLLSK